MNHRVTALRIATCCLLLAGCPLEDEEDDFQADAGLLESDAGPTNDGTSPDAGQAPATDAGVQVADASTSSACGSGQLEWFVAPSNYPNAIDPNLDQPFRNGAEQVFEFDFDTDGSTIDTLVGGSVTVGVGIGGVNGDSDAAEIFWGAFVSGEYGTVAGGALLNRNGQAGFHSRITFSFSEPVFGFGAWVYDDHYAYDNSFRMTVVEADDSETASVILDAGNRDAHYVEGFMGVTSPLGIRAVVVETYVGGQPHGSAFELDHIQFSLCE